MIKSLSLLTREDGLTREQFMKHWVEVHAPLAHRVPGLRRYVQSHIVEERTRPDIPTIPLEVVEERVVIPPSGSPFERDHGSSTT
jgi:uncharacterized protein (TIGR02118 family)